MVKTDLKIFKDEATLKMREGKKGMVIYKFNSPSDGKEINLYLAKEGES